MLRSFLLIAIIAALACAARARLSTALPGTVSLRARSTELFVDDSVYTVPIKFKFDISGMTGDTGRTCYAVNSTVGFNFGGPVDPTACSVAYPSGNWTSSLLEPNCTITCGPTDVISTQGTSSDALYLFDLANAAGAILGVAIKHYPVGTLLINITVLCGQVGGPLQIPSTYASGLQESAGTFLVLLTARPFPPENSNLVGHGFVCQVDDHERPVVGHLNLNPRAITRAAPGSKTYRRMAYAIARELIQMMGFSDDMYDSWRLWDSQGRTDLDRNAGRAAVIRENWFSQTANIPKYELITPTAVSVAKTYFGCVTIDSVELENFGSVNYTQKRFFETRLFRNEIMAGEVSPVPQLSVFTLAALRDTGWYRFSTGSVDAYTFLQGAGCTAIAPTNCPAVDLNSGFCTEAFAGAAGCTHDHRATAVCDFQTDLGVSLPTYYQHYSAANKGGLSGYADYCAWYAPQLDCTDPDLNVAAESKTFGSQKSLQGRCMMGRTYAFDARVSSPLTVPNCFSHACYNRGTQLKVRVGRVWYDCPGGTTIDLGVDYNGTLTCPSAARIQNVICNQTDSQNVEVWPTITSLNVTSVSRLQAILITGINFATNMSVWGLGQGFNTEFTNVNVLSDTQIEAVVPNVTTLIAGRDSTPIHVVLQYNNDDPIRRTAFLRSGVAILTVYADKPWQQLAYEWMFVQNLIFSIVMLAILGVIIVLCVVIIIYRCSHGKCRCCCCKR